jgi:copper transport protein
VNLATAGFVATTLDDFLDRSGATNAELVRDIGGGIATFGVLLAVGVLVFLGRVHRGTRDEVRALVTTASFGGVAMLCGGMAELSGIQAAFGTGWGDVLSVDVSSAPMLRLLAGLLVVFGLADSTASIAEGDDADGLVRWSSGVESSFGIVGVAVGVLSFSFDGHTVTQGPRLAHLTANVAHVAAGGTWFGGVVALIVVAVLRHRTRESFADHVVRYSSVATTALVVAAAAGVAMSLMIVDDPDQLTGTEWGRRLLVKLVAVVVAAAIGAYHHFVTVPRFAAGQPVTPRALIEVRTTLVIEALVLGFVVVASVLLVNGVIT